MHIAAESPFGGQHFYGPAALSIHEFILHATGQWHPGLLGPGGHGGIPLGLPWP